MLSYFYFLYCFVVFSCIDEVLAWYHSGKEKAEAAVTASAAEGTS